MTRKWPEDFPENCPPDKAEHSTENFYRLVDSIPPTRNDFLRTRDEPKNIGNDFHGQHLINSYGLSLFKDESEILAKKQLFSNAAKNKKITHGCLCDEIGQVAKTYSRSHYTLWLYQDSEPEKHLNIELKEKP